MPDPTDDRTAHETQITEEVLKENQINFLREQWVQLSCRTRTNLIKKAAAQITELEAAVYDYQKALITRIRLLEEKKFEHAALQIQPSEEVKRVEFNRMMECPDIESVVVDGNRIIVTTRPIYIEYDGIEYDIGKFTIYLAVDGGAGWLIKFKNLTRTIGGGYPHPHIETDGRPCLGNIKECLPSMVGAYQYGAAVLVAIQYLKSYSNDERGKPFIHISRWPQKKAAVPQQPQPLPLTPEVLQQLQPLPPIQEEAPNEIGGSVNREEGVAEETREALREVIEQLQNARGGSSSGESSGSVTGDQ